MHLCIKKCVHINTCHSSLKPLRNGLAFIDCFLRYSETTRLVVKVWCLWKYTQMLYCIDRLSKKIEKLVPGCSDSVVTYSHSETNCLAMKRYWCLLICRVSQKYAYSFNGNLDGTVFKVYPYFSLILYKHKLYCIYSLSKKIVSVPGCSDSLVTYSHSETTRLALAAFLVFTNRCQP